MPTTYAIPNGRTVFDSTLWTGNGTSVTVINAARFQPDLVWGKSRSAATSNYLYDTIRGATKYLSSDTTGIEGTAAQGLQSFTATGFTLGNSTSLNNNTSTYVGWQWQAGQNTTTVNTSGTITSTVSANTAAGFSIVTYTGTGANATVGHGLGVAPSVYIIKNTSAVTDWPVFTTATGTFQYLYLNTSAGAATPAISAPTSTVLNLGTSATSNGNGNAMVAYCWAQVPGFSQFGSYTGNNSTDGNFIYTGFRPKYVIVKRTDTATNWVSTDGNINPYNVTTEYGYPGLSSADLSGAVIMDLVSNGFKLRCDPAVYTGFNSNGGTYVYMAWAENPFKYANAR